MTRMEKIKNRDKMKIKKNEQLRDVLSLALNGKNIHRDLIRKCSINDNPLKLGYIEQIDNSYLAGRISKAYKLTTKGEIKLIELRLFGIEKIRTNKTIKEITLSELSELSENHILIDKNMTQNIKTEGIDKYIIGTYKNKYVILNLNKQKLNTSRLYNTFVTNKHIRQYSNYQFHYDDRAAMQTVFLNLYALDNKISFEQTQDIFPNLFEYTQNTKQYRETLSECGASINQIKVEITKVTESGSTTYNWDILSEIKELGKFLTKYEKNVKKEIREHINNSENEDTTFRGRRFYLYEYYETLIRNAKIDFIGGNHLVQSVHDCVYTTNEQNIKKMEEHVFQETGLKIKIDH